MLSEISGENTVRRAKRRAEGCKGGQEGCQGGQEGRSALLFWSSWNTFHEGYIGREICRLLMHPSIFLIPYNGYFLRLEIFAILVPKRSILIFAFLIFAIPVNRKKKY